MKFKETLPVTYLLFTSRGRIDRRTWWTAQVLTGCTFYVLTHVLALLSNAAPWLLYPLLFWALGATAIKRLHDRNRRGWWLLLALIPLLGPLWLLYRLGFRRGTRGNNRFGAEPGTAPDYFRNPEAPASGNGFIVDDITQINPVTVADRRRPESIEALQDIVRNSTLPFSVGGGRFSMGGQTASDGTLHLDLRGLNRILEFSAAERRIRVEAGTRWCDIQACIDPHGLSVKIMQTYANFTVGGSLSVNVHGRYMGQGPLILSVRSIDLMLADGTLLRASRTENTELFFASVGGYNALGIIVRAELDLVPNEKAERWSEKMRRDEYRNWFARNIRTDSEILFHNGDLYPPHFRSVRAVSWKRSQRKPTVKTRLMPLAASYPIERYFISAFSRSRFGKWRREHLIDPLLYAFRKVHWRNYEAGYDVAELEPRSRRHHTYVLQEYFVPVDRFDTFSAAMASIFRQHRVNVINVSIRHALPDDGTLLAWARTEVFAFVVWYRQGTAPEHRRAVGEWTRALIDAALGQGGTYYLPYQAHATADQFHRAYPGARKLFALKDRYDPDYRFRNILWDTYYAPAKTT